MNILQFLIFYPLDLLPDTRKSHQLRASYAAVVASPKVLVFSARLILLTKGARIQAQRLESGGQALMIR
jgi:hypothetical protein